MARLGAENKRDNTGGSQRLLYIPYRRSSPHPLQPLPRFGETNSIPFSFPFPHISHPSIPESEPSLGADRWSPSFNPSAPLVKAEPQRPVTEEEPKIAGDLDQEQSLLYADLDCRALRRPGGLSPVVPADASTIYAVVV